MKKNKSTLKKSIVSATLFTLLSGMTGLIAPANTFAQGIVSADTAAPGTPITFSVASDDQKFITCSWEFESNTFAPILSPAVAIPNTGSNGTQFNVAAGACMVYDTTTKTYSAFVTSASGGFNNPSVQRIDFGSNPNNASPAIVNLGNPNNAFITNASSNYNNMQDIKIVMDDNGVFHGFINNGGVVHWTFGNGIANPPTLATRIFTNPSVLGMSMNTAVIKYYGSWYLFIGQTFGTSPGLVRLDLGNNLNTISSSLPYTVFPAPSGYDDLGYLAVIKENNQWYITMAAHLANSPLFRFDFGTNLLNTAPTVSNLGSTNPPLNFNRGLNFVKTCDTFYMLGVNNNGYGISFNYQNNITNVPVTQNLGQLFEENIALQVLSPYWYKDTLWQITASYANNPTHNVYRLPIAKMDAANTTVAYYNSSVAHTFNTPGTYDVRVYCDQGDSRGPQSFCKTIVVQEPTSIRNHQVSDPVRVFPNPVENILNIDFKGSGAYTYNIYNVLGQLLYSRLLNPKKEHENVSIDLSAYHLSKGNYYLQIMKENSPVYGTRLVKM